MPIYNFYFLLRASFDEGMQWSKTSKDIYLPWLSFIKQIIVTDYTAELLVSISFLFLKLLNTVLLNQEFGAKSANSLINHTILAM